MFQEVFGVENDRDKGRVSRISIKTFLSHSAESFGR